MIFMQPIGGLCNRMRSIGSAIELSRHTDHPLHIYWVCNFEINCKLSDLFDLPEKIFTLSEVYIPNRVIRFSLERLADISFSTYPHYRLKYNVTPYPRETILPRITAAKHVYIRTDQPFYFSPTPFTCFTPKPFLQEKINAYRGDNLIGIHIRRTDNVKSSENSPLYRFIHCMIQEIETDSRTRFFVSTDDPQIETHLRNQFQDRIITHTKRSLDRNNPLAIQDAVIDLYSLANCRKLIGSYWSSFTETAGQINQIKKVIISSELPIQNRVQSTEENL